MKHLLVFFVLLLNLICRASTDSTFVRPDTIAGPHILEKLKKDTSLHITFLTEFDLRAEASLISNWRYKEGDDLRYASPRYNDTTWVLAYTDALTVYKKLDTELPFPGIGWFRQHFYVDTSAVEGGMIGLRMEHAGASEIYLDGHKIASYGVINGKDSTLMETPSNVPFSLTCLSPGMHVIAIRYANYEVDRAYDYNENAGFNASIGYMNDLTQDAVHKMMLLSVFLLPLMGIFIALSIIHLCLFFFYKAERTNLYFSIFTIATFIFLYCCYAALVDTDVKRTYAYLETAMPSMALMAFSLSGFSNRLFSTKKTRFYIITACCATCMILWFLMKEAATDYFVLLFVIVLLEIVFLSIRGIRRKIPGAKIIGIGISFVALFVLVSIALYYIGELSFQLNEISALIYILSGIISILAIPVSISVYLAWSFANTSKRLAEKLRQVQQLSERTLEQEQEKKRILENKQEELEQQVAVRTAEVRQQKEEIEKQHTELKSEKKKSDDLLLNILPEEIAEELKNKGTSAAKHFDKVSVLFTDFVDFTKAGERMTPQELVDELHTCFKAFDEICAKYSIEKIKTIGDAYLAVCGLPLADLDHAINTTKAAIEIRQFITARKQQLPETSFNIRIGIHSGSVVAGIVGVKKFAYDIWGDTVNTAARMEQNSEPGKINISEFTYQLIKDNFTCTFRGQISAKNKGELSMYFVENEK